VTNAYLLCRIIDTIEDEPSLRFYEKKLYCNLFVQVLQKDAEAEEFSNSVYPKLSKHTSEREKELIDLTPDVIQITNSFHKAHRQAIIECVEKMAKGMVLFQENRSIDGVEDLEEMEKYCYYVAGVVGEMLTKLFCLHSSEIAIHEQKLMQRASSFGKGLQMTNILKDLWSDYDRSCCWLPRSVFEQYGFDLKDLKHRNPSKEMQNGIIHLIGVTHAHLKNAFDYSLLIPENETGIRKFCLWAIGMAVLTLRKIYKNLDYVDSDQVKITRFSVKSTIASTNLFIKNDFMLKNLFKLSTSGLPYHKGEL